MLCCATIAHAWYQILISSFENPEADKEDYDAKQKEVENIANPIMRNFYAGGAGGEGGDDMGDFGDG